MRHLKHEGHNSVSNNASYPGSRSQELQSEGDLQLGQGGNGNNDGSRSHMGHIVWMGPKERKMRVTKLSTSEDDAT